MPASASSVVLFLSHDTGRGACAAFMHLQATSPPGASVRWLLDVAAAPTIPAAHAGYIERFDSREFGQWGFATMGNSFLPGHCHLPVLRHYRDHPDIERLWSIEYDVRFTGAWSDLFGPLAQDDADLLACHLRDERQEPRWRWWHTLQGPETVSRCLFRRSFCVVTRLSARAMQRLVELQSAGWRGHQEIILPTLLAREGMVVRDLNDAMQRLGLRHVYSSVSGKRGSLLRFGTLRYRPVRRRAGLRRNMLYHPVKD